MMLKGRILMLIALVVIVIIIIVLTMPVGLIKKVRIKVTLEGEFVPDITELDIDKKEFTYLNWATHEVQKFEIVAPYYTLTATICDPPSDCDSDSISFNWGGDKIRYSFYVPTFIGERELRIELLHNNIIVKTLTMDVFVE